MIRVCSTLKTVNICVKCSRNLKETEVYFYFDKCTECIYQELKNNKGRYYFDRTSYNIK